MKVMQLDKMQQVWDLFIPQSIQVREGLQMHLVVQN